MAGRQTLAGVTAAAATAAALLNIKSGASQRIRILELGVFQPGTGTPTVVAGGFGKAANSGSVVHSANIVPVPDDPGDPASICNGGIAFTTAPTAPTLWNFQFSIPATLGAGVIKTWPGGLIIPISSDWALWNNGGNTSLALRYWLTWDE